MFFEYGWAGWGGGGPAPRGMLSRQGVRGKKAGLKVLSSEMDRAEIRLI